MLKKSLLSLFTAFAVTSFSFAAYEDQITITTYYPSPYGSYNELRTYNNTYLATEGGSVGVGTTSPQAKLDVYMSNATISDISNINTTLATFGNSYVPQRRLDIHPTGALRQYNSGGTIVNQIDASSSYFNSNVGVGTTSPQAKLDVYMSNATISDISNINTTLATFGNSYVPQRRLAIHPTGALRLYNGAGDLSAVMTPETSYFIDGLWVGTSNAATRPVQGKLHVVSDSVKPAIVAEGQDTSISHALYAKHSDYRAFLATASYTAGVYGTDLAASTMYSSGVYGKSQYSIGVRGDGAHSDFYADGGGINYNSESSIRWKRDIRPISNALERTLKLRGVYFTWDKEHGGKQDLGMIAEEVGEFFPEVVAYEDNGKDATGLDYSRLTAVLIEAVKEQQEEIESLKGRIKEIEDKYKNEKRH